MSNVNNPTTQHTAGISPCTPEAHQRTEGRNHTSELLGAYFKAAVLLGNIKRDLDQVALRDPHAKPLLAAIDTLNNTIFTIKSQVEKMHVPANAPQDLP